MLITILCLTSVLSIFSLVLTVKFIRESSATMQQMLSNIITAQEESMKNTLELKLLQDDLIEYKKDIALEVYNSKNLYKKTATNPDE